MKQTQTAEENLFSILVDPPPSAETPTEKSEVIEPPEFRAARELDQHLLSRARAYVEKTRPNDLAILSTRVPPGLDEYLGKYVFRHNIAEPDSRRHITKQAALAEAIALFFAAYPLLPDTE